MKGYVESVGVELEGAIPYYFDGKRDKPVTKDMLKQGLKHPERFEISSDQSLGSFNGMFKDNDYSINEFKYWGTTKELQSWLKTMYTKFGFKGNKTCGFHIHLKINDENLYKLASTTKFWEDFKKGYTNKYKNNKKYLDRMENPYCRWKYKEDTLSYQYNSKSKVNFRERTAINLNSIPVHGTLEIRIMPHQDTYMEASETVAWVVKSINKIYGNLVREKEKYLKYEEEAVKILAKRKLSQNLTDGFSDGANPFGILVTALMGIFAIAILLALFSNVSNQIGNQLNSLQNATAIQNAPAVYGLTQPANHSAGYLARQYNLSLVPRSELSPDNPSGFIISNQASYIYNPMAKPTGSQDFPYTDTNGWQGMGYYFTSTGAISYIGSYSAFEQQSRLGFVNDSPVANFGPYASIEIGQNSNWTVVWSFISQNNTNTIMSTTANTTPLPNQANQSVYLPLSNQSQQISSNSITANTGGGGSILGFLPLAAILVMILAVMYAILRR